MPIGFVLINVDIGCADKVQKQLGKMKGVYGVYPIYGVYDIIAKVETKTMEKFKELVTSELRKLKNIRSTLTMVVIE